MSLILDFKALSHEEQRIILLIVAVYDVFDEQQFTESEREIACNLRTAGWFRGSHLSGAGRQALHDFKHGTPIQPQASGLDAAVATLLTLDVGKATRVEVEKRVILLERHGERVWRVWDEERMRGIRLYGRTTAATKLIAFLNGT